MTRIISGFAGSLSIAVPPKGTRPTSDRVREAIFSALDARGILPGASVLDLYAGSGALGLEAASRGAAKVTLVENNHSAVQACRKNAALVTRSAPRGRAPEVTVSGGTVLSHLAGSRVSVDVCFIDPPYELDNDAVQQVLAALEPRLHEESVVVLERSSRTPEPEWPAGIVLERRKDYGDTALFWLGRAAE